MGPEIHCFNRAIHIMSKFPHDDHVMNTSIKEIINEAWNSPKHFLWLYLRILQISFYHLTKLKRKWSIGNYLYYDFNLMK